MARSWIAGVLTALVAALVAPAAAPAGPPPAQELPLGPPGLHESRVVTTLARGVTYTRISRGVLSAGDGFAVDVGFTLERAEAERAAADLRTGGLTASVVEVDIHAPDAPLPGPLAFFARVGPFATQDGPLPSG